jgi:hypothetical protein
VLLRVVGPHNVLHPEASTWRVEIVHDANIRTLMPQDYLAKVPAKQVAHHIAWVPPLSEGKPHMPSMLSFICRGRLFCLDVECYPDDSDATQTKISSKELLPLCDDATGPLRHAPGTHFIVMFGADRVTCLNTSNPERKITSHHLDGRWDEVSGVAFCPLPSNSIQCHLTSHIFSASSPTSALTLPLNEDETSGKPIWRTAIQECETAFSTQHKLQGNVISRIWGIASSPMGDLIATATSLLPSDAPAYVIPSEQQTVLTITHQSQSDSILPANGGTASTISNSVLLFAVKAYIQQQDDDVSAEAVVQATSDAVHLLTGSAGHGHELAGASGPNPIDYLRYMRARLFIAPHMRTARHRLLVDFALGKANDARSIEQLVIERLVNEALNMPTSFSESGELSNKIRSVYSTLKRKLQTTNASDTGDYRAWQDECRICGETIPFDSVHWARCQRGHQFSRCGLTFLPLQQPGVSKQCDVCGTQFFDEYALPALANTRSDGSDALADLLDRSGQEHVERAHPPNHSEMVDDDWVKLPSRPAEPAESMARILFAAFDKCIYCGGDF